MTLLEYVINVKYLNQKVYFIDINIAKDVSNNIHKLELVTTHEPPSVAAGCILLVVEYYSRKG
jgi:hypothetical protein